MSPLIVEVQQGKLQGIENESILNGQKYYSFLGIPYAKPPIGDLRFQAPQPSEKWVGVYEATFEKAVCAQRDFFPPNLFIGSENCLYLNIDVPQVPSEVKVPKAVMVFLHGGGFACGYATQEFYSPDYLITRDVILVRVAYRLHVFGFLNLGLPDCAGNAGLKDQTLAIKWVKENIASFGGDPNNITVFGESAGGSAVHLQTISPLAKGLFHKAIMQSGSSLVPWSMTVNPKAMAEELGERMDFDGDTTLELLQFLRKQNAEDLTRHASEMADDLKKKYPGVCTLTPFMPSVEEIKEGAFLPDSPENLIKTADPLPIIYGLNDKEGIIAIFINFKNIWELLKNDFSTVLKNNFKIDQNVLPEISAKVLKYYFGDEEKIGPDAIDQLINLFSDICFYQLYEPVEFAIKSSTPPFVYEFAYDGTSNMCKLFVNAVLKRNMSGALHGDELGYIFHTPRYVSNPVLEGENLKVIQNMIEMWTNFAKTGVPADESIWKPSTSSQPRYLRIDHTLQLVEGEIFEERLRFLKNVLGPAAKPHHVF
ncbi:esterase FE4-like [Planococcus citri]|uniref:esterase FE4-like n=1 Tax=Planococcus citri TaxID=170843 RepID=UPI0031F79592